MDSLRFYDLDDNLKELLLKLILNEGDVVSINSGMCGDVYIFDRGSNTIPQYSCAKIPKLIDGVSDKEIYARFVNELKNQLKYYHHQYVHWAYDFKEVMGVPVALFRYWGSDLRKIIKSSSSSDINKISIIAYLCAGLRHCYSKGLVSHQDLKPENIFIRNMRNDFSVPVEQDVYNFPLLGDFGLANASVDSNFFDGARPYMAPEQWERRPLSSKTDVFALGVILFEMMSGGFHPAGIKLSDFWPKPIEGNTKKWTKAEPWKKWASNAGAISADVGVLVDGDILELVNKMLSSNPDNRPDISVMIDDLLQLLKSRDMSSFVQVSQLISHYDSQASQVSLEESWPYLSQRWKMFKTKFG
ncbi:protein kinase [Klebsiella pneumoniae]|uniref:protein kinase domain-containing protein n=1 Tax=Klebsiella quasipneumoniae TaxID=1463165 RepID=UPI0022E62ED5|nr:protein kinase [Klebsiella quasipneumoniae]HBQ6425256.1 protein kinase [Klebsiella pneumoniae]HBV2375024.1 protein kinase [Klebsiella quasipneumoniae]HDZ0564664.1 protein kinase [Klebsiella quasipneumoniae]